MPWIWRAIKSNKNNFLEEWLSLQKCGLFLKDFLFGGEDGFTWLYMFDHGMSVPSEFEIIDFQVGLYAAATDIDKKTDMDFINARVKYCEYFSILCFMRLKF